MVQLIISDKQVISPQIIRDCLQDITDMMIRTKSANDSFFYVYCILYCVSILLQRYETCCRETILLAGLEENESVMRREIIKLQKHTLYDELNVPRFNR